MNRWPTARELNLLYRMIRRAVLTEEQGIESRFTSHLRERHPGGPDIRAWPMGNAGTLRRLAAKGFLTVVVDDATTPVYVLADGWRRFTKRAEEYWLFYTAG